MTNEYWVPIDGIPYEVSNIGRIKYIKTGYIRKEYISDTGYCVLSIKLPGDKARTLKVHRLVAQAFIPRIAGKNHVNHKDSDRTNNRVENLEWCTPGENVEHSRTYGTANRYAMRGEKQGRSKLKEIDVINIRHCRGSISGAKLGVLYSVKPATISSIWMRYNWRHI